MPDQVRLDIDQRQKQYENPDFVLVSAGKRHIWIHGQHYRETTRDSEITVGDVFYDGSGADKVFRVAEIDEDASSGGHDVEIEYLYSEGHVNTKDDDTRRTDGVTLAFLRGDEESSGYPPVPLEKVGGE